MQTLHGSVQIQASAAENNEDPIAIAQVPLIAEPVDTGDDPMDPVVHFELPAEDRERMVNFYTSVFGWQTQMLGPEMGNYTVVTTTESDQGGRPSTPGTINGGFYIRTEDASSQAPSVVIAVGDIQASVAEVEKAGGTILSQPNEIPGVGQYASFRDTEGNRMSLLQPLPRS